MSSQTKHWALFDKRGDEVYLIGLLRADYYTHTAVPLARLVSCVLDDMSGRENGFWLWEGDYEYKRCECGNQVLFKMTGTYRPLTQDELLRLSRGRDVRQ